MAYIGKQPVVGNFQVCDAISVVNGQAAYTMQVGSTNVEPENANHMLVSLNGVLQKPGSSFTISGSTITFASNLATGDVIDFIILLGDTLNIGTPSDDTVTAAKIGANAVTAAKLNNDIISGTTALTSAPDDTDEFLVSDAGTLKRIDYSLIKGGGAFEHLLTTTASDSANVTFDSSYITTTYLDYMIVVSGVKPVTDNVSFRIHLSVDNGSNYLSSYRRVQHARNSYGLDKNSQAGTSGQIELSSSSGVGGNSLEGVSGVVKIFDPMKQSGTTDIGTLVNGHMSVNASDSHLNDVKISGSTNVTTAINNIKVFFSSGNIESGKISLYGRKVS